MAMARDIVQSFTGHDIEKFNDQGFIAPVRILDEGDVAELRAAVDDYLAGRLHATWSHRLAPALQRTDSGSDNVSVSFMINLWECDKRFERIALHPGVGHLASQLLGSDAVRLLEDDVIAKEPEVGRELAWHQDFSYWPIATPAGVTCWIALDDVSPETGGMEVAAGSHRLGERLPVNITSGAPAMADQRPGIPPMANPAEVGCEVLSYHLKPGEAGFHHCLTWHASTANTSDRPRRALALRLIADGTIWLGSLRFPFRIKDEDAGIPVGDPLGGPRFPKIVSARLS